MGIAIIVSSVVFSLALINIADRIGAGLDRLADAIRTREIAEYRARQKDQPQ